MSSWHSYPKIFNLGHAAVKELMLVPHQIQEKVDGSQFSFGIFRVGGSNHLQVRARSKAQELNIEAPEKLFAKAVSSVIERAYLLEEGLTYRGEFLAKPKHNALAYDRAPTGHVILFDINTDEEEYLPYDEMKKEAARIGLEVVPRLTLSGGCGTSLEDIRNLLETISILGGQKIEGVVVKPLVPLYGLDKKMLMGKFVSEAYKEVHAKDWKSSNPKSGDILENLIKAYQSESRWNKAIQHLRERGELEDSPRDIGKLIKEVPADLLLEEEQEIKAALFKWAWPHISRAVTRGLPEFYKQSLLKKQFEGEET